MTWTARTSSWLWIPTALLMLLAACTDEAVLVQGAAGSGGTGGAAGAGGTAGSGGAAGTGGVAGTAGAAGGSAGTGGTSGSAGAGGPGGMGGMPGGCSPVVGRTSSCDTCMEMNCATQLAACEKMNDCSCMMWGGEVGQMNCMFQCATWRPVDTDYEQCYDTCGKSGLVSPETVALIECIAEGGGMAPPVCPSCFPMPGG
ncbi:MAG: hypothetical protein H6718_15480 [Polyangiaceae bacterium]|nr:hypothetical protein [Polyangiaceae bacterium]MCB9606307.1 hypothetical protein [Polyangiaceae bacterium]